MASSSHLAVISHLGGPVLRARVESGSFSINEAVRVGPHELLGEVLAIDGEAVVVQVYEETSGLQPGDSIRGDGRPLSVPLGPGLLGLSE